MQSIIVAGMFAFATFGVLAALDNEFEQGLANELVTASSYKTFEIPIVSAIEYNGLAKSAWGVMPATYEGSSADSIPIVYCIQTTDNVIFQNFGSRTDRGVSRDDSLHASHQLYRMNLCEKYQEPVND